MSQNSASIFIEHVRADPALKFEISAPAVKTMENILDLAAREGYDFNAADLEAAYKAQVREKPNFKLTDVELSELSITPDYLALYLVASNSTSGCDDCNSCTSQSDECDTGAIPSF